VPTNVVSYAALGASDTTGYGSSVACVPFTVCSNGTGYVQTLVRYLESTGKTVTLVNVGVPGAVLSPATQALGNSLGRDILANLMDGQVRFVPNNATLVTLFIGGNDVNTVAAAIKAGVAGSSASSYIGAQADKFGQDLRTVRNSVRDRAPSARMVVLNLPNFAGLPYASGLSTAEKRTLQEISVQFSTRVNAMVSADTAVVDTMCDDRFYHPGLYSSDGFHPNDFGYAHMANLIFIAATTSAPTPQNSCSPMRMF
jgi:lysophospholipase L1-like esterase